MMYLGVDVAVDLAGWRMQYCVVGIVVGRTSNRTKVVGCSSCWRRSLDTEIVHWWRLEDARMKTVGLSLLVLPAPPVLNVSVVDPTAAAHQLDFLPQPKLWRHCYHYE
jgi:hypothetical protein